MRALQTQQASLDTTILLGGSAAADPGGKTLVDYLTNPESNTNDAAKDDAAAQTLSDLF